MIGAFARMIGGRDRLVSVQETADHAYAYRSRSEDGTQNEQDVRDAPPEDFVEHFSDEGGTVYFAPLVEMLRNIVQKSRAASVSCPAQKDDTGPDEHEG